MKVLLFEERQGFSPWVTVLIVVGGVGGLVALAIAFANEDGPSPTAQALLYGLIIVGDLFVFNLFRLTTRVYSDEIYVFLGILFPVMWKHIPLSEIEETRPVQYRPLRDAGGWGMRFGRFEGRATWFYNARGDLGVLIVTRKRPYILGSQDPEQLHAAIAQAMADSSDR